MLRQQQESDIAYEKRNSQVGYVKDGSLIITPFLNAAAKILLSQ